MNLFDMPVVVAGEDGIRENCPRHVITGAINFSSSSLDMPGVLSPDAVANLARYHLPIDVPSPDSLIRSAIAQPYTSADIFVGDVCCDWLTLTTFDRPVFCRLLPLVLARLKFDHIPIKLNQYAGFKLDGCFYGSAVQLGRGHYMLQLHGSVAHQILEVLLSDVVAVSFLAQMKCTRCDVKLDSLWHEGVPRFGDIYSWLLDPDHMAAWSCHGPGPRPELRAFVNESGLDTLYIGARSSRRMQRVYVKQVSETRLLRWEVEFKADLAAQVWLLVLAGGIGALAPILAAELASVPLAQFLPDTYALCQSPAGRVMVLHDPADAERTLAWLHRSVTPAVMRLRLGGGRVGDQVGDWVGTVAQRAGVGLYVAEEEDLDF